MEIIAHQSKALNLFFFDVLKTFRETKTKIKEKPVNYFIEQQLPDLRKFHENIMKINGMEKFYPENEKLNIKSNDEAIINFLAEEEAFVKFIKSIMHRTIPEIETNLRKENRKDIN